MERSFVEPTDCAVTNPRSKQVGGLFVQKHHHNETTVRQIFTT